MKIEYCGPPGHALAYRFQQHRVLGAGQQVLSGTAILIRTALDDREQVGNVLDLVENDRRRVLVQEQLGVLPGVADVDDGVEHDSGGFGGGVGKQRALARLPCPEYQNDRYDASQSRQLSFEMPPSIFHPRLLALRLLIFK